MLFWSVVRHARHLSTTVLTPNIKLGTVGLKTTLSWVLWGIGVLGEGHATPSETKKETPGTPHSAYSSLSLPAGDLNEGRSFLNEFRYIPFHSTRGPFLRAPIYSSSSSTSSFSLLYIFLYPLLQFIPPQNRHQPGLWVPGCSSVSCRTPWRSIFLQMNNLKMSKYLFWRLRYELRQHYVY